MFIYLCHNDVAVQTAVKSLRGSLHAHLKRNKCVFTFQTFLTMGLIYQEGTCRELETPGGKILQAELQCLTEADQQIVR